MRFLTIVLLLALSAVSFVSAKTESDYQKAFTGFIKQYGKTYAHDEFFSRYNIFKANMQMIQEHEAGDHPFSMAMNEFGDLTFEEFHSRFTGFNAREQSFLRSLNTAKFPHDLHVPVSGESLDWRQKGAVNPIKDQKSCGSCWAFSAVGAIEGGDFVHAGGKLNNLAEQQLVDCGGSTGNQGCNGGLMDDAFQWVINNKGICAQTDYPYTATDGTCKTTCTNAGGQKITGFVNVKANDENDLLRAISLAPVSVAVQASGAFQFYSGGVFNATCGKQLDHGILAVGYGTDASSGLDYYIVRNSWGVGWGEQGHIRLVRGKNQCGVAAMASFPQYPSQKLSRRHH